MPFPFWDDSFLIGIPEIDEDHKYLFKLLRDFKEAMRKGEGILKISEIISALEDYAVNHFKREEDYLQSINHPEYENQKSAHEAFIAKVAGYKENHEQRNMVVASQILLFISNWLVEHVSQEDVKLKPIEH